MKQLAALSDRCASLVSDILETKTNRLIRADLVRNHTKIEALRMDLQKTIFNAKAKPKTIEDKVEKAKSIVQETEKSVFLAQPHASGLLFILSLYY